MPIVAINNKNSNTLLSNNSNNTTDVKLYCASKVRATKSQIRTVGSSLKIKDTASSIPVGIRMNGVPDQREKSAISNHSFGNLRGINNTTGNPSQDHLSKSKDFVTKKFIESDPKQASTNHQVYKSRNTTSNITSRFQQSTLQRENHLSTTNYQSRPSSRNDSTTYVLARKTLEQNTIPKMASINFPPLRAPQSIVNVRHPFVTEARTKHEIGISNSKPKSGLVQDVDPIRQTYQNYGTSITSIPSVQNVSSIATNLSPYPRPDSFPQPTVTNVLFPETAQFPQSPSYNTTQLNQYQTYDPGSFATTPVNVNPVIPQFPAENSIPYPQYENQFVTTNHYSTDIANSQYQYSASVTQIQESPLFIQSLHSPIAVTDQFAAPNYARAVRTELIPRMRRPSRFNN